MRARMRALPKIEQLGVKVDELFQGNFFIIFCEEFFHGRCRLNNQTHPVPHSIEICFNYPCLANQFRQNIRKCFAQLTFINYSCYHIVGAKVSGLFLYDSGIVPTTTRRVPDGGNVLRLVPIVFSHIGFEQGDCLFDCGCNNQMFVNLPNLCNSPSVHKHSWLK